MKTYLRLLLPAAALGGAALLLIPQETQAFNLLGGSLSISQRDVRVFNNFTDTTANDNVTADANFPGYLGAPMSIWKACIEWGSGLHGNGNGDPHQVGGLGSGGANFDVSFQGLATGVGGINDNIHSELAGSSGGVLAFTESPGNDGWRIRYYEGWTWADGPSASIPGSQIDLQGVACHEYGHALGLDHSTAAGATMQASITGTGVTQRSIATDDSDGVKAIYGAKSATKPVITAISVAAGGVVTVTGTNFSTTGNEVWFTQKATGGTGTPIKLTNVTSNGTSITVTAPATAGKGDILVRNNGTGNANLSNSWPIDPGTTGGGGGGSSITGFTPASIPAIGADGQTVIINGTGFVGVTQVSIDGIILSPGFPSQFSVLDEGQISCQVPLLSKIGNVTVNVTTSNGLVTADLPVTYNATPTVDLANSDPGFMLNFLGVQVTMASFAFDTHFLFATTQTGASVIPGLIDLDIGNNFAELILLGTYLIDPVKGYKQVSFPITTPLPTGTPIYVQTAVLPSLTPILPLVKSNFQKGTILF